MSWRCRCGKCFYLFEVTFSATKCNGIIFIHNLAVSLRKKLTLTCHGVVVAENVSFYLALLSLQSTAFVLALAVSLRKNALFVLRLMLHQK
jgi:hypothetical protein